MYFAFLLVKLFPIVSVACRGQSPAQVLDAAQVQLRALFLRKDVPHDCQCCLIVQVVVITQLSFDVVTEPHKLLGFLLAKFLEYRPV